MRHSIYIIILLFFGSCSNFVRIQKSANFTSEKKNLKKVICIAPDIILYGKDDAFDLQRTAAYQDFFLQNISDYSRAAGFDYNIVHPFTKNTDSVYFNRLLPLKTEILQTLFERDNPLNAESVNLKRVNESLFVDAPRVSPEFSDLAEKYNTPYFAYFGLFSNAHRTVIFNIIIDVRTSETLFRQIVYFKANANKRNLRPVMYDMFNGNNLRQ